MTRFGGHVTLAAAELGELEGAAMRFSLLWWSGAAGGGSPWLDLPPASGLKEPHGSCEKINEFEEIMNPALIVFLALLAAALAGLGFWLRALQQSTTKRVKGQLRDSRILCMDERANCFGVESAGQAQIRGNGCLACTETELYFQMWLPRKELRVQRSSITQVGAARLHLGKSKGRKLLKIGFRSASGEDDSVAWQVRHLDRWLEILRPDGADSGPTSRP